MIFYIINNIVTYVYNIVWALSIFFSKETILFLYCLYCLLYCMYYLQYCLEKNYVVCIVYNIVGVCVLIQYGFVLFIHHRYLLSRFLLFFIGIIVLHIGYIVTLKWQQYFTTIHTINKKWKSLPKNNGSIWLIYCEKWSKNIVTLPTLFRNTQKWKLFPKTIIANFFNCLHCYYCFMYCVYCIVLFDIV